MLHCKRPCHDCPFRKDIPAYQSHHDVARNLACLIDGVVAICHHTSPEMGKAGPQRACAGYIVMRRKLMVAPLYYRGLDGAQIVTGSADRVFDTAVEFHASGACRSQTFLGRRLAWIRCQPRHKRLPLLTALRRQMRDVRGGQ